MNHIEYIEHESFNLTDNAELKNFFLCKIRERQNPTSLKEVRLMGMDYDFKKDEFFMAYLYLSFIVIRNYCCPVESYWTAIIIMNLLSIRQ